ncbi:MAG TPA: carboxylating nicotinate-nucleotide diphosphorylase [Candidatus Hydrogenedentes bacterium]|nr:carboxylating nicotinate-nucleotide diphosphorylase [Candidatus Hydrogenedentota bacterium]HOJ67576.1 carboxylating nicotinate-nucleotide diphosphorylase [Candidatus Hydrogenedentota bacterium]HOK89843.1 carboxylating nicotinate-nucleotide diphosphorylase [Candidatus Hydrogenedentota bacterium]HPO29884.1 carboxylating nicotinate-nucleotide diphosphorylase [Candidatus Hydrogenedentota bacterium]
MQKAIEKLVSDALAEDIGQEDLTTNTIVPPEARCVAKLFAKQDGVLSGTRPFRIAFELLDADIRDWRQTVQDGGCFKKGDLLIAFNGRAQSVLTAERTALNFIQRLSGVATLTAKYVAQLEGLNCRVCSTRKTTPLMRQLEKAAIVHGGGANHRHTLFNGVLIKENHIMMAGSVTEAIRRAREGTHHLMRIGVEVQTLEEFDEALAAGAEVILLDNMDNDTMREAARRATGKPVILEASGNATLERVRSMAETGVHFISVGALTHSAPAVDLSLLIEHVSE